MLGLWWFSHWRAKQHDYWLLGVGSGPRKVHIKWPPNSRKPLLTDKNGAGVVRIKRVHARGWMRQLLWRRHGWKRWGLQEGTGQAGAWRVPDTFKEQCECCLAAGPQTEGQPNGSCRQICLEGRGDSYIWEGWWGGAATRSGLPSGQHILWTGVRCLEGRKIAG